MKMASGFVYDTGDGCPRMDHDTGEVLTPVVRVTRTPSYGDGETGELTQTRLVYQRSKFRVPRAALKRPVFETAMVGPAKKEDDWSFDRTLLILPLLMVLPGWAILLYCMLEVLYHDWSHTQKSVAPCKTPMLLLFQVTCAECVAKTQMQKVGKLQDERTLRINSRRILNYDYSQFGIGS